MVGGGTAADEQGTPRASAALWWVPATSMSFLTVVHVPRTEVTPVVMARAIALFPLVGAALGALLGGIGFLLDRALPASPIAALLLAAAAAATGALHLDGLMDTADGAFGGRTRERRLEIMRDSRVGAFGVAAALLIVLAQYACLAELTGAGRLVALVTAYTASRWAMVLALGLFPPARSDGLGASVCAVAGRRPLLAATIFAVAIGLGTGLVGILGLVAAGTVALAGGSLLTRRLGGLTGDAYGALAVVSETAALYLAVALQSHGVSS